VKFKVNCERCDDLLIRGEIYNYKGQNYCEDCYVLMYLFGREAPDALLSDVQPRRRISAAQGSDCQLKDKLTKQRGIVGGQT